MNPYGPFAASFALLIQSGKTLPFGGFAPAPRSTLATDAPAAMLFSPHPDDECVTGGLPLRLLREARMRVLNVAVTQGSNPQRQQPRWLELQKACAYLGFETVQTAANGLEKITPKTRAENPQHWSAAVKVISALLTQHQPRVIFFPHEADWNGTHIGTHLLVMDALKTQPADFRCLLVETEFWGQMTTPNLLVESSTTDVGDLLAALSFHEGEVRRNPYHLRLPAGLQDNVRRGAELVGGQGGAAPDFTFATLYRVGRWQAGHREDVWPGGKQISAAENPGSILDSIR